MTDNQTGDQADSAQDKVEIDRLRAVNKELIRALELAYNCDALIPPIKRESKDSKSQRDQSIEDVLSSIGRALVRAREQGT